MDINTIDNGKIALIKTSKEFILKINEEFFGPFPNTKSNVNKVMEAIKGYSSEN